MRHIPPCLTLLVLFGPLAANAATFEVEDCGNDPTWGPLATTGTFGLSHPTASVGSRFGLDGTTPLQLELHLPSGETVVGRGLPPLMATRDPLNVGGYAVDRSVIQIELPTQAQLPAAEEELIAEHTQFSTLRPCVVEPSFVSDTGGTGDTAGDTGNTGTPTNMCPYDDTTVGMTHAYHIQDDLPQVGSCTVTEVQVARGALDLPGFYLGGRVNLWLEEGYAIAGGDRVRVAMTTLAPLRSTDWSSTPIEPQVRWAHPVCYGFEDATYPDTCFTMMDREDAESMELTAAPPAFLRVNAPLDVLPGESASVDVVLTDLYANPSFHTSLDTHPVVLRIRSQNGTYAPWTHEVLFDGAWRVTVPLPTMPPGAWTIEADVTTSDLPDVQVHRNWTRVWKKAPDFRRSAGDLHFHTGVMADGHTLERPRFLATSAIGDHRTQSARTDAAYRYLEEAMGLEFGAASGHAVLGDNFTLPPGSAFDPFLPGEACDIGAGIPGVPDWWTALQELDATIDRPDFAVFPAFEWHSNQSDSGPTGLDMEDTRLHRVVLYRDVPEARDLPILPGTATDLPPQCLPLFLAASGWSEPDRIEDLVVMPHMHRARATNVDWDFTYDWNGQFSAWLALLDPDPDVARAIINDQQRLVEIFSARNRTGVTEFEGDWTDGSDPERWSIRYALAQGSRVGIVASSDNHGQTPGSNDDYHPDHGVQDHHEPGGIAFVARRTNTDLHNGVFDALRERHTYGTSGIRAWLDVRITDPLRPKTHVLRMGEEGAPSGACELTVTVELMAGVPINKVDLLQAQVLHTPGGTAPSWTRKSIGATKLPTEVYLHNQRIPHPGQAGTHVYYVRAFAGPTASPKQDAVWSSPIWITWGEPTGC